MPRKIFLNCSDKNYSAQRTISAKFAKFFGGFDEIRSIDIVTIDEEFKRNNSKILEQKRGAGYWLWKPYFIQKVLNEASDGDFVFYCDSGAVVINKIEHLTSIMNEQEIDIMLFELPLIEYEWSSIELLNYYKAFETGVAYTNQICGGYLLLRKSARSTEFVKGWLDACCEDRHLTDITNLGTLAKAHRHDQSILSVYSKTKGIKPFKDPSDYGRFPMRYFSTSRLFRLNSYLENYPVILLSNRKVSPYTYFMKYYLRCFLSYFGLRRLG